MHSPWQAPGTAPLKSPCGVGNNGQDGLDLPETNGTVWQRGSVVEMAHAIWHNHGGGYAYRLCPKSETPNEECFQAHHLAFVGNSTTIRYTDGRTFEIPAIRTSTGTFPAGSEWTRNP